MAAKNLIGLFLMLLLVAFSPSVDAQEKWIKLFNGKDLTGWKQLGGKAKYEAIDGAIVGTTVLDEPNSFLCTANEYSDFILEMDFRLEGNSNSGVQFRSASKPEYRDGKVHGYQMEIDPMPRAWTGGIYEEQGREWLYPVDYNPQAKIAYKHLQWNHCRIECIGNVMRTWINGIAVANLVDEKVSKGFIGLQVHSVNKENVGEKIHWKNIRIQTESLKASPADNIFVMNFLPNKISDQEQKNGVVLLWDGVSTNGWRGAYKAGFPEKGWEIVDGTLHVRKSGGGESENGGDIVTAEEFGSFDLQFEFKMTEGANSGVKYFVTESEGNKGSAIGLEYQILDDENHPDAKQGVVGNRTLASLYDLIPSVKIKRGLHSVGDWNSGRIVVYPDNCVEHWLNGYKVVEYVRGSPAYNALVARSKYSVYENFGMAPAGRILLQDHGDDVFFRSIKIRKLK